MEIRVSGSVIIVLIFVHLCWTYCSGKMELCSNSLTGFENGTMIPATVGKPVTISFCVQWEGSDGTLYGYIKIEHPNHLTFPRNYYSHSAVTTKLTVNIVVDKNTARIKINIRKVEHADIRNVFTVELYTKSKGDLSAAAVFTFQLMLADNDITVSTTQAIRFNNETACNTTSFMSDFMNTTAVYEPNNTWCPTKYCPVTDDICLFVMGGIKNMTTEEQCAMEKASHIAVVHRIDVLKPCLTRFFQFANFFILHLNETRYIDVQSWTEASPSSIYRVGCVILKQQLAHPVITWFTLQLWDYNTSSIIWTRNLLDSNNTSVTIPASNGVLNVTCQASGFPKPEVAVVRDNEKLDMLPNGVSLIYLNDDYSGLFMCQATNIFSLNPTHIRVKVSVTDPESGPSSPSQFDASVSFAVGASIGVIVGVLIIVAVILVRVFFQKRAQRSEAVSQNVSPNTEYDEIAGTKTESAAQETPAVDDLDRVEYIEIQDVQYERQTSAVDDLDRVQYIEIQDVQYERHTSAVDDLDRVQYIEIQDVQYERQTPAVDDLDRVQYIEMEDVQYERPVACIHRRRLNSNVLKSDVEYANTVTPL